MSEEQGLTPYETREILFYKTEKERCGWKSCSFRKPLADAGKNGRAVRGTESSHFQASEKHF